MYLYYYTKKRRNEIVPKIYSSKYGKRLQVAKILFHLPNVLVLLYKKKRRNEMLPKKYSNKYGKRLTSGENFVPSS